MKEEDIRWATSWTDGYYLTRNEPWSYTVLPDW